MRWGATRVFAQHFAALAQAAGDGAALAEVVDDPASRSACRRQGLWQLWFWTPDATTKGAIEDTLLGAMAKPQPAWIESNLRDAVYNLADENIRYLYNNWVPLLPRAEDRERAIRGRLAVESRLAEKFAAVLETVRTRRRRRCCASLTEFPLRRGDIYDLDADLTKTGAAGLQPDRQRHRADRVFRRERGAARPLAAPLLDSPDPEMRRLAAAGRAAGPRLALRRRQPHRRTDGSDVKAVAKLQTMPEGRSRARPETAARPDRGGQPYPAICSPTAKLDEAFFRGYVEPIL